MSVMTTMGVGVGVGVGVEVGVAVGVGVGVWVGPGVAVGVAVRVGVFVKTVGQGATEVNDAWAAIGCAETAGRPRSGAEAT
jgi:hypothetical protein